MGKFAWVTLATNDSYSLGALVVASSLKRVNTAHELVALVTPGVSDTMKVKLRSVFNLVEEVNVLDSQDAAHLALLKRPELGITFTKLHCWRLTQYEKCVFLDADTLILQNSDELFEREELSAAPDVGWPDCFNSGVFVYRPNLDTFGKLVEFATTKGSFDGGDQGLLNQFFNDWATKDIANRLPFIYNTTTTAVYSYIPAFKQFGDNLKILHFIGNVKPWLLNFDPQSKTVQSPSGYQHLTTFLQLWWTIFCDDVHPNLSPEMNNLQSSYGSTEINQPIEFLYIPPTLELLPHPKPNNCNTENEITYYDPWENYDNNNNTTDNHSHIDNDQYFPDDDNNINNNSNDSIYEEIHNKFEVVYNNLIEQQTPIDRNEQIINNSFDNNTNLVVVPSSNASLIHPPSAQILSNVIPFEEVDNLIHKENSHLAHGNDINLNKIIINHAMAVSDPLPVNQDENNSSAIESGIAGALAKLTLGANRSPEQEEFENHMRRQCWESGNIDYLGKDSFDNIWRRITQTIESGTKQDFPVATQPEPASETTSTALPEEKLKVEIPKKVDDRLNPNERNVIAVCSPHELMRSLSSPGLAQEQIITTVLPNGKTVQQRILTFPEREIEIEDYERIEILGPITRKITTETTRIVAGKESQTDVVVRTEIHAQDTETKAIVEKQQTVSQNILTTPQSQPEPQQIETNQNQTVALKTNINTPKISITDVLKPLPDDKFEFDAINNITTITRKTQTGSEMIIATVTPDGRNRVQTKTFFDPVEVSRTEVTEEEYTEEQTHTTTTTSNVSSAVTKNETEATEQTTTTISENTSVALAPGETSVVTIEKTATGHKEITTITTADGLTRVQTKTFYDPVEIPGEEEVVEEYEETTTTEPIVTTTTTTNTSTVPSAKVEPSRDTQIVTVTSDTNSETTDVNEKTVTTTVSGVATSVETTEETTIISNEVTSKPETVVPQLQDSTTNKSETTTTSTTDLATTETTNTTQVAPGEETTVVTIEKTPTGHKEITTITSADGLTRVQTKTFYDPVEIPGEEEVVEEYEETTTTEPIVTTTTTTNISTVPAKPTEPARDTQITTVTSDTSLEKTDTSETSITTTVTGEATVETTEETTIISSELTSKPETRTETTTTSVTEVETTDNTTTQITPSEEKRVVTIEKTPTGHMEITTITTVDGLTRVETKTFYDPTEEEVVEEYEETTVTEPVVTTKTTTTTSSAPAEITKQTDTSSTVATVDQKNATQVNTQEITEETVVTSTTTKGVATNEEIVEETTVVSTETPVAIKKSGDNTTSTVEITEETTITTENVTANSKIPVNKTSETTVDTSKTSTLDTSEQTLVSNVTGTATNVKTVEENTVTSIGTVAPQPLKAPADNKVIANISTNVTAVGQVTTSIETRSSQETIEIYEESHKSEPTVTTKTITNTAAAPSAVEKPKQAKPKAAPDATKPKNVSNQKSDTTKTSTLESEVTSLATTKTENVVAKTTVGEEKTSVVIEKTPTGHKEITTIVSADGETRIRTKTFYDPVEQEEEEEIEEYEETHTSEPVVTTTTTKKTPAVTKDTRLAAAKTTNQTKKVTEIETTTETLDMKTPQKLDKKKTTAVQKVDKVAGAVTTSVIGQETTTTKTKTSTIDTSKTVTQKSDMSATSTEKTKTLKDSKTAAIDSKKKTSAATDKTKSTTTTNQTQKAAPQGEPQKIVTTKRVENGTEHTTTYIFPDGTKKIETKTFFDAVEVSGDEEEIEEYEEIEEEEEVPAVVKPATKEPPKPAAAPAPKKLVPPTPEQKPTKEDSQFQPSKLKIPAAFATANAAASGPVKPPLRKASVPKVATAGTATGTGTAAAGAAANGASGTKDTPTPPPRKSFFGKLNKTTMLLLLLLSFALIYNHYTK